MLSKIDCREIVRDHYSTFVDYGTGKRRVLDYALFLGIPLGAGALAAVLRTSLSDTAVDVLTNAMAILAGLLFNLLVLIHALGRGFVGPTGDTDSERHLAETYSNIAYAVLAAVMTLIPLIVVGNLPQGSGRIIGSAASVSLTVHFTLTLLMVLKRIHVLLRFDFRRRK